MSKEKKEQLVTREGLEELIKGIKELEPYHEFLKKRWIGMVMWWHERSVEARWKYFLLRAIVVAGGVLIPVLSALNMRPVPGTYLPVYIAVVGAIVAGSAAWEGVANYGEIWREKRRAAELLKVEGWQFLQRCGKYKDDQPDEKALPRKDDQFYKKAFPLFAAEVENMIAREVGEYLGVFDQSLAEARQTALQLIKDLVEEARKKNGPQ